MFRATMLYRFHPERFDEACALWRRHVPPAAKDRPGMVRLELFANPPEALAVGVWREAADAEAFMRTGVFDRLMAELGPCCSEPPRPGVWRFEAGVEAGTGD